MVTKLENYKNIVDRELGKIFVSLKKEIRKGNLPDILYQAMHYSVFNGGKRIRPILCLASYNACCLNTNNQQPRTILPFACGIEFIHTFSLIQDDLPSMDNDDLRRGKLSLHRAFDLPRPFLYKRIGLGSRPGLSSEYKSAKGRGEAIALLSADALFALAFELFTEAQIDDTKKNRAIAELARICGPTGLVAGQVLDIMKQKQEIRSKKQELINKLKTAELIAGSMKIGAIVAGTKENIVCKLEKAGTYLGLLFQTTDDIIDKNQKPKAKNQKFQGEKYAEQAKKIFSTLGVKFDWFILFTDYLQKRKV